MGSLLAIENRNLLIEVKMSCFLVLAI